MTSGDPITVHELTEHDVPLMHDMLTLFADAFEEAETYNAARPSTDYLRQLLGKPHFIALGAMLDGKLIGGIAAYELEKFEQARSEIYIYDLAVAASHRRGGVATAMISELQRIAARRRAWVIFVQADQGDDPAIELYTKLGEREEVLHFDIAPDPAA